MEAADTAEAKAPAPMMSPEMEPTFAPVRAMFWICRGSTGTTTEFPAWMSAARTIRTRMRRFSRRIGKSGTRSRSRNLSGRRGRKVSVTKDLTMKPAAISIREVAKKVKRFPRASAMYPPRKGPRELPMKMAVCRRPIRWPTSSSGTSPATITVAAATVPVTAPWRMRSVSTSEGLRAKPMRKMTSPPPNMDRSSMDRRP